MTAPDPDLPDATRPHAESATDRPPLDLGAPSASEFSRTRADLAEFRTGDPSAFERVWKRHRGMLEVLITSRIRRGLTPALRVRLDAELDDILQEAAVIAFARLGQFEYRGPGSILAWLEQIGTHLVSDRADYWRAGKRSPSREKRLGGASTAAFDAHAAAVDLPHRGPGPATEHDQEHARRAVATALSDLSEREQTVVLLRFFGGATWSEIAAEVHAQSGDAVRKEWSDRILPAFAVAMARVGRSGRD